MKKTITITLAALLTAAAGWALAQQPVSMRGSDVAADDKAPEVKAYLGKKPGLQRPVARTFQEQPPVIPHATDNFDEVTLEENQCLGCHGPTKYQEKRAPKVGDSHFIDREGKKLSDVSMARHNCTQCHVPQVDAPPLVDNAFVGNAKAAVAPVTAKPAKNK